MNLKDMVVGQTEVIGASNGEIKTYTFLLEYKGKHNPSWLPMFDKERGTYVKLKNGKEIRVQRVKDAKQFVRDHK